jgi:hypothetical protein
MAESNPQLRPAAVKLADLWAKISPVREGARGKTHAGFLLNDPLVLPVRELFLGIA